MPKSSKSQVKDSKEKKPKKEKKEVSESESDKEEEEQEVPWYDNPDYKGAKRGEKRWDTLSHNGALFAPPYVPHGVPLIYEGKEMKLHPEEEEVASMFADMKGHDHYTNPEFRANFFRSWKEILVKHRGPDQPIRRLELCDFSRIHDHIKAQKAILRNLPREEKKKRKAEKEAEAEPYTYCIWDGKKEPTASYRVEPPGLFRGRGKHPKVGTLKKRVHPEDVTINIGENDPVPECPKGHKWGGIVHDHHVTWLAYWRDNVTDGFKYIMLAPASSIKGASDRMKYDRARRLKSVVDRIRNDYNKNLRSPDNKTAQLAVTMYFIDRLALRVGNEKGDDEADTVGCCSLRPSHVTPMGDNKLYFSFLGKDSIRYENTVEVEPVIYSLIEKWRKEALRMDRSRGATDKEKLFYEVDPSDLNKKLKDYQHDLTAKVFRTYNASECLQKQFDENPMPKNLSTQQKMVYFNAANTRVAVLCNHQKGASKGAVKALGGLKSKIAALEKYLAAMKEAKEIAEGKGKNKGMEAATKHYYSVHDAIHDEWLGKHGTDEQKEQWEKFKKDRTTPVGKPKSSQSQGDKKSPKKKRAVKEEDSDDELVATIATKSKKKSTSTKKETTKTKRGASLDADLDEIMADVLAATAGKKGKGNKGSRSPSPSPTKKRGSPKKSPSGKKTASPKKSPSPKRASPKKKTSSPKKKTSPKKSPSPKKTSPKKAGVKKAAGKKK